MHGGSQEHFIADYRKIARSLNLPGWDDKEVDILGLVRNSLSEDVEHSWLMVVDNADNADDWLMSTAQDAESSKPLIGHLPQCSHGMILFTTRDNQLGTRLLEGRQSPIPVNRLAEDDSVHLLLKKLAHGCPPTEQEAHELTTALEHLPLTITQAAAYLNQIEMTASEYIAALRAGLSDIPELLSETIDDPVRNRQQSNSVFQTWKLSFEHISRHDARAADLLSTMAMLDRQAIPIQLLQRPNESPMQFKRAISKLKAFSFVMEDSTTNIFSMHRLVQHSTQKWLAATTKTSLYSDRAVEAIARCCPPQANFDAWPIFNELKSHIEYVLAAKIGSNNTHLERASILHSYGHHYMWLGQEQSALPLLEEARTIRVSGLGTNHEQTLNTESLLASVYGLMEVRYLQQARPLLQSVVERAEKLLGTDHRLTLKSRSRLAMILSKEGKSKQAKRIHLEILGQMERAFGPTDSDTLKEISHLLYIHNSRKEWTEAHEMGQRALRLRTETLGPKHPDTVTIMAQLCWTLNSQEQWAEAVKLGEQVLNLRLDTLGPDHPKTLVAMKNLVRAFRGLERYEDAKHLQMYIVDVRKRDLGSTHWQTSAAIRELKMLDRREPTVSRQDALDALVTD